MLGPDHGDRALALRVDEDEAAALGLVAPGGRNADAPRLELRHGAPAELVVPERGVERRGAGQASELERRDGAPSPGLLPCLSRLDDLSGARNTFHGCELDALDVAHDGDFHALSLTSGRPRRLQPSCTRWRSRRSSASTRSTATPSSATSPASSGALPRRTRSRRRSCGRSAPTRTCGTASTCARGSSRSRRASPSTSERATGAKQVTQCYLKRKARRTRSPRTRSS